MSSAAVYLKISQITEVYEPDVYLKDIAEIHCKDRGVEAKARALKVASFPREGRKTETYVGTVMELLEKLEETGEGVAVESVGEQDFVVRYRRKPYPPKVWEWLKTAFVAAVAFCGAAFAIMTFNNDANVSEVFKNLYVLAMGEPSDGTTVLEAAYSAGLGIGILVFFNHFAGWKITVDPTPIEVEMRLYEENLNRALILNHGRTEAGADIK